MKRSLMVVTSLVAMLALFAIGAVIYTQQSAASSQQVAIENSAALSRFSSVTYGSNEAKVHIVEFMDPACEACRAFYPYVKNIINQHPGKIKLTVRYANFHQGSDYVAQVLEAARAQDKYWPALEALLATQDQWTSHHAPAPETVWKYLGNLGLNFEQMQKDMNDPKVLAVLEQDRADAQALQISKTPSFFVNGKPLIKFGYEELAQLIQGELKAAYPN
ncbi:MULTISPECIES: DsbA family protein [Deefgea]|uniref:Thioredoxin domain-containing protein n=1 Tax=Deefgea chitinilytica TaxID=570276 RepID=A0ABS2CE96_9NEIS|nr:MULTISPECIES: thioredoxin domain-containing protein [Deefgea]MBM5572473.1 thioredoxin domain-containing protein [Deefgea chitinilytica]MBM9889709.1 thioredoxin domain-containing protein [Deefgea sp. CFH1-16]